MIRREEGYETREAQMTSRGWQEDFKAEVVLLERQMTCSTQLCTSTTSRSTAVLNS